MIKQGMMAAALVLGTTSMTIPAAAQPVVTGGLVNVTITDTSILTNFLNDTQLAVLAQVGSITVQVPVSVAATVCGVSVAVLGAAGSNARCTATSGSQALADVVARQMNRQKK